MTQPSLRYPTLLELAVATSGRLGPSTGDDVEPSAGWQMGPCVGDDDRNQPSLRYPTLLELAEATAGRLGPSLGPSTGDDVEQLAGGQMGPCVGDDVGADISLGPSVGDDEFGISCGPSVGDDAGNIALGPSVGDDEFGMSCGPSVGDDAQESDVRLKTDIHEVGTTSHGLPLYRFRYIGGAERYEGVMAQDVLKVMPEAVVRGLDGYYRVKYPMLGIEMRRV